MNSSYPSSSYRGSTVESHLTEHTCTNYQWLPLDGLNGPETRWRPVFSYLRELSANVQSKRRDISRKPVRKTLSHIHCLQISSFSYAY